MKCLLGRVFQDEEEDFIADFSSRIWFTYRVNMFPITENNVSSMIEFGSYDQICLTSDVGWGCMYRSMQMLLGQTFSVLQLGRDFRARYLSSDTLLRKKYAQILSFFSDVDPSSPLSLHQLVYNAVATKSASFGEWIGPHAASYAAMYSFPNCLLMRRNIVNVSRLLGLKVFVSTDAGIYRDAIVQQCKNLSDCWDPLLILIPLRLGVENFNPSYVTFVQNCLLVPQCVGIAGGKPNSSYFFVGFSEDKLIYLDPHITHPSMQISLEPDDVQCNGLLASYSCLEPRLIRTIDIDPSLVLGFLVQKEDDIESIFNSLSSVEHSPLSVGVTVPNYEELDLDAFDEDG